MADSDSGFLSYEEELGLSDLLVERRRVVDELKSDEVELTEEMRRILRDGDWAANKLVGAYVPFIVSVARSVYLGAGGSGSTVELQDLVNDGVLTAMRRTTAFKPRGTGDHPGVRFGTYIERSIRKDMKRRLARESTPVQLDTSIIQASWVWLNARQELRERLGRQPTPEEVEAETGIDASAVEEELPHRSRMGDVQDPLLGEPEDRSSATAELIAEAERYATRLMEALGEVFSGEIVMILSSYLGLDRHHPRMEDEVAEHLGLGPRVTRRMLELAQDALYHPVYRLRLAEAIRRIEERDGPS